MIFLNFRRRPKEYQSSANFLLDPGPIPQKAASGGIKGQGPVPRSRGLSIWTMIASENTVMRVLSLKSIDDTPYGSWIDHSSSVHDQSRSECPKTPLTWEVLPYRLLIVRRSFFSSLFSRMSIQLIHDAVIHDFLIIIPDEYVLRKWKIFPVTNA